MLFSIDSDCYRLSRNVGINPAALQFLIAVRQSQKINKPLTAAQMIDGSLLEEVLASK